MNKKNRFRILSFVFLINGLALIPLIIHNNYVISHDHEESNDSDKEFLNNLKISDFSQDHSGNGEIINITLHQSLMNSSVITFTDFQNTNSFTEPSPTANNFNSSFINVTFSDIRAGNITSIIRDGPADAYQDTFTNSRVTSFQVDMDCWLTNITVDVSFTANKDANVYLHRSTWNIGTSASIPSGTPILLGTVTPNSIGPTILDFADQFLNTTITDNNTWFIGLNGSHTKATWGYTNDGAIDNSYAYLWNAGYISEARDYLLTVELGPVNTTPSPEQISLKINNTQVIGYGDGIGSGYWSSLEELQDSSGILDFILSSDWNQTSLNITEVQINYTKTDLKADATFDVFGSAQDIFWNVTRSGGLNFFDSNINNWSTINFTIPFNWGNINVSNGGDTKIIDTSGPIINGYKNIEVLGAENGTFWYLNASSSNLLSSIDTFVGSNPMTTINFTDILQFNASFSESIALNDGIINLSVYSPALINNKLNFTRLNSSFGPASVISLGNWDVSDNVTQFGIFRVQVSWSNNTAAGFLEKLITILEESQLTFTSPLANSEYNLGEIFNITVYFNNSRLNLPISGADIDIDVNGTAYNPLSTFDYGNGYYNITVNSSDSDFSSLGWFGIRIKASKQYYNNQSEIINIKILGDFTKPVIANEADNGPAEWSTGSLTVTTNVTDNNALSGTDPVQIQFWNPSNSLLLDWTSMSTFGGTGYRYIWSVGANPTGTGYYYRIRANDTSNNIVITSNYTFNIVDTTVPTITNEADDGPVEWNTDDGPVEWNTGSLTVTTNVTDNMALSGTDPVQIQVWNPSNSLLLDWTSMTTFGGTGYRYIWSVGANPIGTGYYYRIRANDTSNNIVITSNYTFNIVDTTDPTITNEADDGPVEWNTGSLTVTANVTDNMALSGTDPVQIRANDTSNNIFMTGNYSFNIVDSVDPTIVNEADDGPLEWNTGSLAVTANVTDNNALSGTDPVQIQIWNPSDTLLLDWTSMSTFGGTGFRYIWAVGVNPIGTGYYYRIRVNDTSNNIVITSNYTFNIVDTVDPAIANEADNGPTEWSTGSLTVTVNVTDNNALSGTDPVQIQIWNPSDSLLLDWTSMSTFGATGYRYIWSIGANPIGIGYYYRIRANDTSNNIIITSNNTFNIVDTVDPVISNEADDDPAEWSTGSLTVSANVTDNNALSGTDPVQIQIWNPSDTLLLDWTSMNTFGATGYRYIWSVGANPIGIGYYYRIRANDTSNNIVITSNFTFNILDTTDPEITNIADDGPVLVSTGSLILTVNATDNKALSVTDPVQIQIWNPADTLLLDWTSMNTFGVTGYRYNWSVGANPTNTGYYYRIRANDTSNNIFITGNYSFNIVDSVDSTDPVIVNEADDGPAEWNTGSLTVTANVTDDVALSGSDPVQIQIWNPSNSLLIDWTSMSIFGSTGFRYIWSVGVNPIGSGYYYRIRANDTSNNIVITSNYTFNIIDTLDPTIVNEADDGPAEWSTGSLTVTANVTDNNALSGTDPVQIQIWNPSNSLLLDWTSMSPFSGTGFRYIWSVGANPIGTGYYYRIRINDSSNNIVITSNYIFNIIDTVDPTIVNEADNGPTEWNTGSLTVTANVTDNSALSGTDPVQIQIWNPSSSLLLDWTSMSTFSGTGYRYIWSVGANPIGTGYYYRIRINDSSNNIVITSNYTFNIVDTVDPVISNEADDGPAEWSTGSLTVTCNLTDNFALSGIDPILIQIYNPTNTLLLDWTSMNAFGGTGYRFIWSVGVNPIGMGYYYRIRVNDTSNNLIITSNYTFNIVDTLDPTISNEADDGPTEWSTGYLTVTCNVTDNNALSGTDPVQIQIWNPSDLLLLDWTSMNTYGGTGFRYNWSVGLNPIDTNYYYRIRANDTSNNVVITSNFTFDIVDSTDTEEPSIINIDDDEPVVLSTGSLIITCNVTDNTVLSGTDPVMIQFWNPSHTLLLDWTSMSTFGSTGYRYNWSVGANPTNTGYYYRIRANDSLNNIAITGNYTFNIVIGILSYNITNFAQSGQQIKSNGSIYEAYLGENITIYINLLDLYTNETIVGGFGTLIFNGTSNPYFDLDGDGIYIWEIYTSQLSIGNYSFNVIINKTNYQNCSFEIFFDINFINLEIKVTNPPLELHPGDSFNLILNITNSLTRDPIPNLNISLLIDFGNSRNIQLSTSQEDNTYKLLLWNLTSTNGLVTFNIYIPLNATKLNITIQSYDDDTFSSSEITISFSIETNEEVYPPSLSLYVIFIIGAITGTGIITFYIKNRKKSIEIPDEIEIRLVKELMTEITEEDEDDNLLEKDPKIVMVLMELKRLLDDKIDEFMDKFEDDETSDEYKDKIEK
jgi:hypothetical protein